MEVTMQPDDCEDAFWTVRGTIRQSGLRAQESCPSRARPGGRIRPELQRTNVSAQAQLLFRILLATICRTNLLPQCAVGTVPV